MNFYFLNTGDTSFDNPANWSNTDGGATVNALPTATDDMFLTANSGDCTINTNPTTVQSLTCTGYKNTLTHNFANLIVNGNIILSGTMKTAVTSAAVRGLVMGVAASLQTNGCFVALFLTASGIASVTLLDTLHANYIQHPYGGSSPIVYTGSFGFITETFANNSQTAFSLTLQAGVEYIVRSKLRYAAGQGNAVGVVKSSVAGTQAKLTVTGDVSLGFLSFTDIDASGGRTLYPFNATITNCINIVSMTDYIPPINSTTSSTISI